MADAPTVNGAPGAVSATAPTAPPAPRSVPRSRFVRWWIRRGYEAPLPRDPARWSDAFAAVVLAGASTAFVLIDLDRATRTVHHDPDGFGVALAVVACAAVALRRPAPVPAALVALLASGVGSIAGYSMTLPLIVALLLAGYAALHSPRGMTILLGWFSGTVVAIAATYGSDEAVVGRALGAFALGLLPVLIGDAIRSERAQTREARELARRIEELRDRDVQRAVAEERLRIARDVHDITGHHLSAISLQAAGAGRVTPDPVAKAALERIHGLTTEALGQTRRALGVLRGSAPAALAPSPRLGQLDALLAPARDAGLAVELKLKGRQRPLPDEIEVCAYRVVQESLTNVVRHANAGEVLVRVEYGERELFVAVDDDGVGGPPRRHGGGLDGMRERVALVHGSFEAGPVGRRGWSVRATLPLEAAT
ncbi:histidine kinase [Conexibacter stalactiti]|uniref:histidine kinase n=1 Tax=Conexibacter stalactiti TaxID=1940611 RepID=A0ABU4HN43_9ACTN|nr:histidine kinase [Conexibacter stalactiti]MDW5594723.1 histidine kinase [Conexibacter stalactiti]MEC5035365.1 histidine kinase [Conexibacter stalactiti]